MITFLTRILIFSCILLLVGQLFGACVFPESGGYATRMVCIEGEWKRKISLFDRFVSHKVETKVEETLPYSEEEKIRETLE